MGRKPNQTTQLNEQNPLRKKAEAQLAQAPLAHKMLAKTPTGKPGQPYLLTIQENDKEQITVEHHGTVSIVVLFINHEISAGDILKRADMAMYQAKNDGRNLIRFFDPDVPARSG